MVFWCLLFIGLCLFYLFLIIVFKIVGFCFEIFFICNMWVRVSCFFYKMGSKGDDVLILFILLVYFFLVMG